jgi:TnpA family transposase
MLKKLASYPKQNGLAKALREIGRIERTLFMLDWFRDPSLRRRVQAGLNKGEAGMPLPEPFSCIVWAK